VHGAEVAHSGAAVGLGIGVEQPRHAPASGGRGRSRRWERRRSCR
jgi:hypothetical protein